MDVLQIRTEMLLVFFSLYWAYSVRAQILPQDFLSYPPACSYFCYGNEGSRGGMGTGCWGVWGLCPAYLIEEPFGELLKALGADEALLVVQLTIAVDNFLSRGKAPPAALTDGVCKRVRHVAVIKKKKNNRKLA